jgi:hypothetical protein
MPFMNRLSMDERQQIIGLLRLKWPERRIARETGFHRATIRRIALELAAEASKCTTPGEVATDSTPAKVATDPKCTTPPEVPTDSKPHTGPEVPTGSAAMTRSACEPHRPFIEAEVAKGRNAAAIYQDLVEHHGYPGAYNAVKRFVGKLRARDRKVSCRFETAPGQKAQVDYGEGALTCARNRICNNAPSYDAAAAIHSLARADAARQCGADSEVFPGSANMVAAHYCAPFHVEDAPVSSARRP